MPPPDPQRIGLLHYAASCSQERVPVALHGNMALFLLQGQLTVQYTTASAGIPAGGLLLLTAGNSIFSETIREAGQYEALQLYFDNEWLTDFFIKYHGYLPGVEPALRLPLLAYAPDDFLQRFAQSLTTLTPQQAAAAHQAKLEELFRYLLHLDAARLRTLQIVAEQD